MDFEYAERARMVMDQVERFVSERVVPNEAVYHEQLAHTDDWTRWLPSATSQAGGRRLLSSCCRRAHRDAPASNYVPRNCLELQARPVRLAGGLRPLASS
jgi:hypothetical protein